MPAGSYERYGLTSNPFRELASESVEDVTIFHVNQESDQTLRSILDEVLDKENRTVVAVTGPQGVGKTERLLLAVAEAKERKAFSVYYDVAGRSQWALRGLAEAFDKAARTAGLVKMLGAPAWLRSVSALAKAKGETYDPKEAGRRIGEALNAASPSFLLLNDLNNLVDAADVEPFAKTLEEVAGVIRPGVLVMFTCYASYLAWLTINQPGFVSRINRTIPLVQLTDDEARLVLAKKLLGKRIVEDLEPTYPFDRTAVRELNDSAHGNPRRLFELADAALERGVASRAYQIDDELVRAAIAAWEAPNPARPPAWQESPDPSADAEAPAEPATTPKPSARRSLFGRSR